MCRAPNIVHIIMDFVFSHHFSCISIRFRQRWKSAALHMKWKCRDCHIGFAASVTLSAYRLVCRTPKNCSYSYEFCFQPRYFSRILVNLGRSDSLRYTIWNGSAGTAISALEPVWHSPPIIKCVENQTLFILLWILFLLRYFRAFYLNFDPRECRVILSYWH